MLAVHFGDMTVLEPHAPEIARAMDLRPILLHVLTILASASKGNMSRLTLFHFAEELSAAVGSLVEVPSTTCTDRRDSQKRVLEMAHVSRDTLKNAGRLCQAFIRLSLGADDVSERVNASHSALGFTPNCLLWFAGGRSRR